MNETATWYVVRGAAETCQIVTTVELETMETTEQWGPYRTEGEAIAKRVGLIRAGKCQPN
ncbi:MAG: hypothetical protein ACFBSG_08915 [Leptolyngbyaceae cyanobacterium]